ncbi:hypothetical protein B0H14DRAFT_2625339 [Mycena olivaceomarginata]|nr:hypothetical protein B0H14DRAFT_2625339 [Mycena olivaceomarginata]
MSVSAKNMMSYGLSTEIMKYIPMIVIKFYEEGHRPLSKLQKTSELRMYFPMGTDIGASQSASPRQGVLKYPRPRGLRVILLENLYLNIGLVLIGGAGPAIEEAREGGLMGSRNIPNDAAARSIAVKFRPAHTGMSNLAETGHLMGTGDRGTGAKLMARRARHL